MKDFFSESYHAGGGRKTSYSSMKHNGLQSTVVKVGHGYFCLYCKSSAKPVQNTHFSQVGRRCTCDGALNEMAERMAHELNEIKYENRIVLTSAEYIDFLLLNPRETFVATDKDGGNGIGATISIFFPKCARCEVGAIESMLKGSVSYNEKEFVEAVREKAVCIRDRQIMAAKQSLDEMMARRHSFM